MDYGWISLHRKIKEHWLFKKNKVKSEFEAWVIILMEVNHGQEKLSFGNEFFMCNRGESFKSLDTWAKMFGWTKSKTRRFFKLLEDDSMVVTKSARYTTHLKVLNYSTYQDNRNPDETQMKRKRNADETQMTPNNNDNNDNNINSEGKIQKIWIKTFGRNPNIPEQDETHKLIDLFGIEKAEKILKGAVRKNFKSIFTLMEQLNPDGTIKPKEQNNGTKRSVGATGDELANLIRNRAARQSG